MVRRCLVLTLHLLAVLSVGAAFADGPAPHTPTSLEDIRPIADGLAETFQAINDGDTAKAVETSWKLMGAEERKFISDNEEEAARRTWEGQMGQFRAFSQKFESIELVGLEPISSRAACLHFVLICERTPLSLRVATFQYQGRWYIQGINWAQSFDEKAERWREHMIKLPNPLRHALTIPATLAEKPADATTN